MAINTENQLVNKIEKALNEGAEYKKALEMIARGHHNGPAKDFAKFTLKTVKAKK
jgi:hypothetical protein